MKIGIIGAGFIGLAAAQKLQQSGHSVTIFEKESFPGGLAAGYQEKGWKWPLEKHYHHFFTNDTHALNTAKLLNQKIIINRPVTSILINNKIHQLDSPMQVIKFPELSFYGKMQMAVALAVLKYNPYWKPLEKTEITKMLPVLMGNEAYKMIWEPQVRGKFGNYSDEISMSWFWARIRKRTTNLAYPDGGFLGFAQKLAQEITNNKVEIIYNSEVTSLENNLKIKVRFNQNNKLKNMDFDKLLVTLPAYQFLRIAKNLPVDYQNSLSKMKSLGTITLVLRLKKPFFKDKTYWLSICQDKFPFLAVVEHTNFIDKSNYNNEHIVYIGKYLSPDHPYLSKTSQQLLDTYDPFLKILNIEYKNNLLGFNLFKSPFTQPIIPINYSKIMPGFKTPLKDVFLANIQQVYPWDRGVNYAMELGQKAANLIFFS